MSETSSVEVTESANSTRAPEQVLEERLKQLMLGVLLEAHVDGGIEEDGDENDYRGFFKIKLRADEMRELLELLGLRHPHSSEWIMDTLDGYADKECPPADQRPSTEGDQHSLGRSKSQTSPIAKARGE